MKVHFTFNLSLFFFSSFAQQLITLLSQTYSIYVRCLSYKIITEQMEKPKKYYRDSSWNRPISGSKPRVLMPKNKIVNPSLYGIFHFRISKGVSSLFFADALANPEVKAQLLKQLQPSNVSSNPAIPLSTSKLNSDALAKVE